MADDSGKDAGQIAADDCARQRKAGGSCTLTLEAEDVNGVRVGNDGGSWTARRYGTFGSLIRLRKQFIAEIIDSASDL